MTGSFLLDWAGMAVSLANVILLSWLGLHVLLNTEQRTWGVWLAGCGLLCGAAFFISHTAILGVGLDIANQRLEVMWRFGWLPLVALPLIWYVMVLWYAGFWEGSYAAWLTAHQRFPAAAGLPRFNWLAIHTLIALWYTGLWDGAAPRGEPSLHLRLRHRLWLRAVLLLFVVLIGLLLFASPLPSFAQAAQLQLAAALTIAGFPLLLLIFSVYIILCIGLALDALQHPMPSRRLMGDLARMRARPWLVPSTMPSSRVRCTTPAIALLGSVTRRTTDEVELVFTIRPTTPAGVTTPISTRTPSLSPLLRIIPPYQFVASRPIT